MFDYNKKFITLGIEYDEKEFKPLLNRKIYNNNFYPPTKPIEGGLWGSSLYANHEYKSAWEKYVHTKLQSSAFEHRLKNKSTIFTIKENSRVLALKSFADIYIQVSKSGIESPLTLRLLKVGGNVPKAFENHLYIDFEKLGFYYDAMFVTKEFVEQVDCTLSEFDNRVRNHKYEWDDKITRDTIYISEMFEDWNVESILVLNKECINVLELV